MIILSREQIHCASIAHGPRLFVLRIGVVSNFSRSEFGKHNNIIVIITPANTPSVHIVYEQTRVMSCQSYIRVRFLYNVLYNNIYTGF